MASENPAGNANLDLCFSHNFILVQQHKAGTAFMITTDDLKLVSLEFLDDGHARVSLPHSSDDWAHRRAAAYEMVRQKSQFIPDVLLRLVLVELKEQTPVKLLFRRIELEGKPAFKVEVEIVETEIDPSGEMAIMSREFGDPIPARMAWDLKNLMPASEVLALLLRSELRDLKYAERRSSAKARSPHLIPRSTISDIALDLLQRSEWNYPPGEALVELFRELLNLENPKQQHPRKLEAQEKTANMLARDPEMGVAELAQAVGVNKSSVSRWIKRPDFQALVKRAAEVKGS